MSKSELKNIEIENSCLIKTSKEELYKRWTTSEGLKTFFGADNDIEMKVLGKFEIYFLLDAPEGTRGSEGCQVLSFVPNEMLSFTWNAPPHLEARNLGIHTYVVVTFNETEFGDTEVVLRHLGWPNDERFIPVFEYFEKAWEMVMTNLENCYT